MSSPGEPATHWARWHEAYSDPASPLTRRLAVVVSRIREAVDQLPPGPIHLVSVCAGQGRDLVLALQNHRRAPDVTGYLLEWDEHNAHQASEGLRTAGLHGLTVLHTDASSTNAYRDLPRAQLLLLCGIFGNVSDEDVHNTISHASSLCVPDAFVIWTRYRDLPDPTPQIRRWFGEAGFEELSFESPGDNAFSVGMNRLQTEPLPPTPGLRLFTFIG
jgi:hypothetical protein